MRITLLDNNDLEKWDDFIMSSPEGNFGHLSGWSKVYELYGYKPYYMAAIDSSDGIRGVLRLFLISDIFCRKFLISNPFISYGGICAHDKETADALISKAKELAVENGVQYFEIRQLAGVIDNLPAKKDFITMIVTLGDENFIWKNILNKRIRTAVRKAIKSGLTVNFGKKDLDDFYKVLSINHRDIGTPLHHKSFFEKVLDEFSNIVDIVVVKYQDKVISGALFIKHKNILSPIWGSSIAKYNSLRPNDLLYWTAIEYACKNGFEYFDFGRSTIDSGSYLFKKHWGAKPVQLNYLYFLNKAKEIPVVNAHDNRYKTAISIWKKLPLSIANTVGPRVIKFLPEL